MGTFTPNFNLYKPAIGETGWGALVDTNFDTIDANLSNGLPRAYRSGCATTLNGGTPSTTISIAVGDLQDVGNAGAIRLSAALTKNINAVWAVGSGNGGLAAALVLTASTFYHLFVIKRTDTGVVDAYFDTSISAANIPSPYTLYRRVSTHRTDANKLLLEYTQNGRFFVWKRPNANLGLDLNVTNPGTNLGTVTCTVPPDVPVMVMGQANLVRGAGNVVACFSDPSIYDTAVTGTAPPLGQLANDTGAGANMCGQVTIKSNTLKQINYRLSFSDANTILRLNTAGWEDFVDEF